MFIRKLSILLGVVLQIMLVACTQKYSTTDTTKKVFHIPVVVQEPTKDTIEFIKAYTLRHVWFKYAGKYTFTDTLKLPENPRKDTTFRNDYLTGYSHIEEGDTLNTDGFQIFVDYKTAIHYNQYKEMGMGYGKGNYYFPIYIVNETSKTKLFIAKDGFMFGIQEASDTTDNGRMYPIEHRGYDFCGYGYYGVLVRPGEFVMGLVPKYEGNERQTMKIRLQIGESIYFSPYYTGSFNREQFILRKDEWGDFSLEGYETHKIVNYFYGAIPKGYKERDVN